MKLGLVLLLGCLGLVNARNRKDVVCELINNDETLGELMKCIPENSWISRMFAECIPEGLTIQDLFRDACRNDYTRSGNFDDCMETKSPKANNLTELRTIIGNEGIEEWKFFTVPRVSLPIVI